jgi:hypothetical protein
VRNTGAHRTQFDALMHAELVCDLRDRLRSVRCIQYKTVIISCTVPVKSRDSSVSIVSGYGLDDQAIEVRSLAEAKDFSSNLCIQTGALGPTQPSVQWIPGALSLGIKCGWGVTLTTQPPPSSAEVKNE